MSSFNSVKSLPFAIILSPPLKGSCHMLTLLFGTEKKVFNRGGFHFSCKCLSCLCNVWQIDAVSGRRSVCVCAEGPHTSWRHLPLFCCVDFNDRQESAAVSSLVLSCYLSPPSGCHNASPSPSLCGSLSSSDVASSVHMFETAA